MAKHTEATELIAAAVEAIQAALTLGDEQGHKERWREQDYCDHIEHALGHIEEIESFMSLQPARQALCRLAMALVKMG